MEYYPLSFRSSFSHPSPTEALRVPTRSSIDSSAHPPRSWSCVVVVVFVYICFWCFDFQVGKGKCHIVDTFWQTETGGHVMLPLANVTPTKPGSCSFPFFGIEVIQVIFDLA